MVKGLWFGFSVLLGLVIWGFFFDGLVAYEQNPDIIIESVEIILLGDCPDCGGDGHWMLGGNADEDRGPTHCRTCNGTGQLPPEKEDEDE